MSLLGVLRSIVEFVDTTSCVLGGGASRSVAIVGDHLCAHVRSVHLSLFLQILKVL